MKISLEGLKFNVDKLRIYDSTMNKATTVKIDNLQLALDNETFVAESEDILELVKTILTNKEEVADAKEEVAVTKEEVDKDADGDIDLQEANASDLKELVKNSDAKAVIATELFMKKKHKKQLNLYTDNLFYYSNDDINEMRVALLAFSDASKFARENCLNYNTEVEADLFYISSDDRYYYTFMDRCSELVHGPSLECYNKDYICRRYHEASTKLTIFEKITVINKVKDEYCC